MIGIPYRDKGRDRSGCDCYCLVYFYNKLFLKKELPLYLDYTDSLNRKAVDDVIEKHKNEWKKVSQNDTLNGDLILFRAGQRNGHCGVMISKYEFLHVSDDTETSCIERIDNQKWKNKIRGFYKWV